MKRIEEIEGLSESQLLDKALEESAPIPQGLKKRLEASLEAEVPSIKERLLTGAAVAAAACLAIAVLLPGTDFRKDVSSQGKDASGNFIFGKTYFSNQKNQ